MSREIKFRAWDGKTMHYDVWVSPHGIWSANEMTLECPYGDASTLMQFTGLKDKNGKEIYEGDVAQCDVKIEGRMFKTARGEVHFADNVGAYAVMLDDEYGSFEAGPATDGSRYSLCMEGLRNFIVIGNIYENPDLI